MLIHYPHYICICALCGSYVLSACSAVKLVLRNFAPVIRSNLSSPPSEGIDFSREERLVGCVLYEEMCCQHGLSQILKMQNV